MKTARLAILLGVGLLAFARPAPAQNIFDAIDKGDIEKVKMLIAKNPASVHLRDDQSGTTPLHNAASKGHPGLCELLITNGAEIDATDNSQNTPLHVASFNGHIEIVKSLIDRGADIHLRGRDGGTSLHMAAWGGHPELITFFVDKRFDVNALDKDGYTPMIWATTGKTTSAMRELIKHGADLRPPIRMNRSILHLAAGNGTAEIIEYLVNQGLETDARSDYGNTPLFWAIRNKNYDTAEALINNGADPRAINKDGHSPVSFAVSNNEIKMVELLLKHEVKVKEQDGNGDTLLHSAAYHGFEEMVGLLLDKGSDPNLTNKRGVTALDLAVRRRHTDVQALLVSRSAAAKKDIEKNISPHSNAEMPSGGTEDPVRVTIVYDNYVYKEGMEAGYGFSCYIEGAEKNILFDTGTESELFTRNFRELGLDYKNIGVVFISHEHGDHTGGLLNVVEANPNVTVVVPFSMSYTFVRRVESYGAKVLAVKEPFEICKGVYTSGEMGGRIKEQSLAINTPKGLMVICGCSHPGIVEIVESLKESLNRDIHTAFGGFHLMNKTERETKKIIDQLKALGLQECGPTHCTGDGHIKMFKEAFGDNYVETGVGRVITFDK